MNHRQSRYGRVKADGEKIHALVKEVCIHTCIEITYLRITTQCDYMYVYMYVHKY